MNIANYWQTDTATQNRILVQHPESRCEECEEIGDLAFCEVCQRVLCADCAGVPSPLPTTVICADCRAL